MPSHGLCRGGIVAGRPGPIGVSTRCLGVRWPLALAGSILPADLQFWSDVADCSENQCCRGRMDSDETYQTRALRQDPSVPVRLGMQEAPTPGEGVSTDG